MNIRATIFVLFAGLLAALPVQAFDASLTVTGRVTAISVHENFVYLQSDEEPTRGAGWEDKVYVDIIPSLLPKSAVASSEGLSNQDRHHFDRGAQRILGGRCYDAFKSL